jgi:hypothetical protein
MEKNRAYLQEISALRQECYGLINEISHHRYGMKLLLIAKASLQMTAGYKANRHSKVRPNKAA